MRYKKKYRRKRWAGTLPLAVFTAAGAYVLAALGATRNTVWDAAVSALQANMGYQAARSCIPVLAYDASKAEEKTIYEYLAAGIDELLPIYGYARKQNTQLAMGEPVLEGEAAGEDSCGYIDPLTGELLSFENQQTGGEEGEPEEQPDDAGEDSSGEPAAEAVSQDSKVQKFSREKLNDFDYLVQNFYRVDSTTTTNSGQLNASEMLARDMTIDKEQEGPQILIYHTHSQEGYADSKDASQTVVGLGDCLTQLLQDTYGYRVMHHKGEYDLPDRDTAYSRAAPALEQLLEENPGIQVIIDLHRDGVAEGTRLVQKVNGRDTATIMFFNGLSHTTSQGDIGYLYNPNLADNLAFSFQMQLAAAEYYPGFSRCIYLRGYRYNLHYRPKSLLVEVGAQTNTYEEAVNAMAPLADVLDKVLTGTAQ